jgi:hypothetical protein
MEDKLRAMGEGIFELLRGLGYEWHRLGKLVLAQHPKRPPYLKVRLEAQGLVLERV